MMERVGHRWQIVPGREADYRAMHAQVFPELEHLFRRHGVHEYAIYASGGDVFSHMIVDDFDALTRVFATDADAQRWESLFTDVLRYPNADPRTGWPQRLDEIWALPRARDGGAP